MFEDFKGLWQTTKEIMDNFLDSGPLHQAPNEEVSSKLANCNQELKQIRPRGNCLGPTMVGTVDE